MITRTLKFWGFKSHPFEEAVLEGDTLTLLVNRTDERDDLEDALHNRITGVYGSLGVGKSSFLSWFTSDPPVKNLTVVLVRLPSESADNLYREMLAEVLDSINKGKLKLKGKFDLNCKNELLRLEGTIAHSRTYEVGVSSVIKGGTTVETSKGLTQHTEVSSRRLLANIIRNATEPFVIILDDFHNIELSKANNNSGYLPLLGRLLTTIGQHFNNRNVSFVITLDDEIEKHINKARSASKGAFSFAIGDFVKVDPLNIKDLLLLISVRLQDNGWKKGVKNFISHEAYYALALCSDGHPRRALRVLRNAMHIVAKEKSANTNMYIELMHLEKAAKKSGESIDEIEFAIINYIINNGPTSASDEKLIKAIGILRASLRLRLEKLKERMNLIVERKRVGGTIQVLYSVPNLDQLEHRSI